MTVQIASALLQQIVDAAAASPQAEVCGLLFGTPHAITAVAACANVAADPARHFEIDPAALLAAHRAARNGAAAVVGHYHSHPSGHAVPSPRDAAAALPDGSLWLIAARGEVRAWRAVDEGPVAGRFEEVALRG